MGAQISHYTDKGISVPGTGYKRLMLPCNCFFRLAEETSARKKIENALADAHRVIADKEAQLQDARVTTTQHQNAHMDTKRDRDGLQSALTQTQQALDVEVAARADLQTLANQLKEKLNFQQQLHEKVLIFRY